MCRREHINDHHSSTRYRVVNIIFIFIFILFFLVYPWCPLQLSLIHSQPRLLHSTLKLTQLDSTLWDPGGLTLSLSWKNLSLHLTVFVYFSSLWSPVPSQKLTIHKLKVPTTLRGIFSLFPGPYLYLYAAIQAQRTYNKNRRTCRSQRTRYIYIYLFII